MRLYIQKRRLGKEVIPVNAPLIVEIKVQIHTKDVVIRLRPAPGQPHEGALQKNTVYDALLSPKEKWLRVPKVANLGLSMKEWKIPWDDLHIEIFRKMNTDWIPFDDDDWTPYEPR